MKTKKLLSFMLALVMVVSMMATLGITASAAKAFTLTYGSSEHGTFVVKENTGTEIKDFSSGSMITNATYMVETTPDTGYEVDSVKVNGVDATKDSKNNYSFDFKTMPPQDSTLVVTFKVSQPTDECYLDLDSTTTDILEKKELDQNYNLTVTEMPSASGAVTKVKLSWEINDINAVRMDNKVWDTTELKWVTASSSTTIMDKGTAKFTLENYSSVKIDATASFKAETGFKGTASYDVTGGKVTLDTANGNDTYSKTNVPTKVINATITTDEDDFNGLTATTTAAKYGTYTVTISKSVEKKVTVLKKSEGGNTYLYAELTGFDAGEHTYEWSHNWKGSMADGDMTAIPSAVTVEDNGAKLNLGSSPWNYCGNYRVTVDGISSELTGDSYIGG